MENVVATMEIPNNHQDIFPLAKKKDLVSLPAFFAPNTPIITDNKK